MINGSFEFEVIKYRTERGSTNWLKMTHEKLSSAYESELLHAFALKYATRLSYQKTSELVLERTGTSSVSDQRIYKIVEAQAAELVAEQAQIIRQASAEGEPIKAVEVDIYNAQTKEVMWFGDGICVCEQKARARFGSEKRQRADDDRDGDDGEKRRRLSDDNRRRRH
jgi:hypothetical protein